ncbi:MAG: hypothetical protein J07HQX50_01494 [Haloquadratum sp. J07HQX50]|nr:MAG: hypothetical protein J07HQX50_01494 [Haloquadratum sp. J07HQX50]
MPLAGVIDSLQKITELSGTDYWLTASFAPIGWLASLLREYVVLLHDTLIINTPLELLPKI